MILFRWILFCLLWFWLFVFWVVESGWLCLFDNDYVSIWLCVDMFVNGEIWLLLDVKLENGWKIYWCVLGEGGVVFFIVWKGDMFEVSWFWLIFLCFDVVNIIIQGYYDEVIFLMIVCGMLLVILCGVLMLLICSNVCLLIDYFFFVMFIV